MIVYDGSITYNILGSEVKFYVDMTAYGQNVVAEYNNEYYYWGDEIVNIELALIFWQEHNNKMLSQDEVNQIMIDNNLK